jgi:hypothetical protein
MGCSSEMLILHETILTCNQCYYPLRCSSENGLGPTRVCASSRTVLCLSPAEISACGPHADRGNLYCSSVSGSAVECGVGTARATSFIATCGRTWRLDRCMPTVRAKFQPNRQKQNPLPCCAVAVCSQPESTPATHRIVALSVGLMFLWR